MVYLKSSISVVDQSPMMARTNNRRSSSNSCSNFPGHCDGSRSAAIDVLILIAVITSLGFLIFPYIRFIVVKSGEIFSDLSCLVKQEIILGNPNQIVYGLIALSILCTALSSWMIVILLCSRHRCGKPNCKGLRKANAEFDIQLETEDCVKSSSSNNGCSSGKSVVSKTGLFQLPRDHHRELEAELKKMAPPNGRAVLVFRAKCGCSVGRLEVPGPKKQQQQQPQHRKIKK